MKKERINKLREAQSIINCSIGSLGISAGCDRYRDQYWTRDFALAGLDALLELKYLNVARKHLSAIAARQHRSGSIPARFTKKRILFALKLFNEEIASEWEFLFRKLLLSQKYAIASNRLNFRRWLFWYADNEILFIIASYEYIVRTADVEVNNLLASHISKAFDYIKKHLMQDGLVVGSDWRDIVYTLSDKSVFSVNIMLWRAYILNGKSSEAAILQANIEEKFWNGYFYSDTPGSFTFDTLGHALAILWDFIPEDRHGKIIKKFEEMKTPFGYKANDMPFPKALSELQTHERTNQFSVIWPFIHGYAILALIHMEYFDLAKEQMSIWDRLEGFYEWYNPVNGRGYGEEKQMWSAALYLRAANSIETVGRH